MVSGSKVFVVRRSCFVAAALSFFAVSQGLASSGPGGPTESLPVPVQAALSEAAGRADDSFHLRSGSRDMFSARNPVHGLRIELARDGRVELANERGNRIGVSAALYGREGEPLREIPGPGNVRVEANTIEYDRDVVLERYANGPLGLSHAFVFRTRAEDAGAGSGATSSPLVIHVRFRGDVELEGGGTAADPVVLAQSGEEIFRYAGLAAWDSEGRALPVDWQVSGREVRIRVHDTGATYPVTIDPFVQQQAKLTSSDGITSDEFGTSVAVSGDTVVVGAPLHDVSGNSAQGAAYVFVRSGSSWSDMTEVAKLLASDGGAVDFFGTSVAIEGDTIVVGAPLHDVGADTDRGAAYVFVRPVGGWSGTLTETAKLLASDGAGGDEFGTSVDLSGDTVVVGAWRADIGANSAQGAAYVFEKPGSGWSGTINEVAKLTASDGGSLDEFGASVGIDGETIAVGARFGGSTSTGAAYVFVKPGSGWVDGTETARLLASDGSSTDLFGAAVAVSGNTVLVGAPRHDTNGDTDRGAAYVFVEPLTGWVDSVETGKLISSDGEPGDLFGTSVALEGISAVVGAPFHTVGSAAGQGAAYEFVKGFAGWKKKNKETSVFSSLDGIAGDEFGHAVAISGGTVVAGARRANVGAATNQGAAYVFEPVVTGAAPACPATPQAGCVSPGKSIVLVKDKTLPKGEPQRADRVIWKWLKGPSVAFADFGDPVTGSTGYSLCVYDETGGVASLVSSFGVPAGATCAPGKPCWKLVGSASNPKGYLYKDKLAATDGIAKILLKAGDAGKSKILVIGKGGQLSLPGPAGAAYFQQDTGLVVQLLSGAGSCWEVRYPVPALKNEPELFRDKCGTASTGPC
ncbi:MAG: hypothetical protein KatS3mg076_0024 [Candidatus Binatia bacterium]|nr:MAG: hypothetical protein KatS3mg076_0024 [Candidatus Binatia bacterium]